MQNVCLNIDLVCKPFAVKFTYDNPSCPRWQVLKAVWDKWAPSSASKLLQFIKILLSRRISFSCSAEIFNLSLIFGYFWSQMELSFLYLIGFWFVSLLKYTHFYILCNVNDGSSLPLLLSYIYERVLGSWFMCFLRRNLLSDSIYSKKSVTLNRILVRKELRNFSVLLLPLVWARRQLPRLESWISVLAPLSSNRGKGGREM